jgi:Tfp pilus assembly protein PilX
MRIKMKNNGSIMIVVVFAIALMAALVAGILQLNTEQIQLMKNEIFAAQAIAIAEAGMADAFARIRTSSALPSNFNSSFGGGSYAVAIAGSLPDPNITSVGTSAQGFTASVRADITVGTTGTYIIRVDKLRINE